LYVDIPNSPSLDISGTNITIAGWINTVADEDAVIIDKPYNADDVANGTFQSPFYQYGIERSRRDLVFSFADSDTTVQSVRSSQTIGLDEVGFIQDDIWQHFAVTYDGTSVKWYVNGVQQNSVVTTGNLQARGNRLRIGGDDQPQQFYGGQLDDLRIYDRTLNLADIRVLAGDTNQTPDVAITQPVERTTFLAGANVTITAEAVAVTGRTIAKVEFFQGSTLLGTDTNSPYSFTWNSVGGGSYSLTAKATDSAGAATNSAAVNIKVNGGASGSTIVNLFPTQDTFLNVNTDIGISSATLNLYTWPDDKIANVILMKFDLSSIPAGATITDAQLNLYLLESDTHEEAASATYSVGAHKLTINPNLALASGFTYDGTNPWTPNSCCNNDIPMAQGDITAAYTTLEVDKTNGFKAWNLTTMAQEWLNTPATNYGVLLNSDATKPKDRYRAFASMEDITASKRPYLQVTYTSASTTVNLFPTQDTFLNINTNIAISDATLNLYTWPANKIANVILMKFDLSTIPAGATITDAQLNLYQVKSDTEDQPADPPTFTADATYTVGAYKPTKNPNLVLATGFTYDGTNPWTPNSCCFNDIPIAQSDLSAVYATLEIDTTNGFKAWNLKTMVQEWLNTPASNYGVLLNSDPTKRADRFRAFASMEDITASKRPYLQVIYTLGTGRGTSLSVARSGNNLVISWPVAAAGFHLESTASLLPGIWSPVTAPQIVVGNQVTVTVALSGSATFYRLSK
ncbi:MAG: DNRLRE domain-containing protein, partial [Verrucomicrobiota bacterium]